MRNNAERALMERVDRWAREHREQMASDIMELVSIRSVCEPDSEVPPFGAGCREALDAAAVICAHYGFHMENHAYHAGTIRLPGGDKGEIGIFCHLDVVPEGTGWHSEPYRPYRAQGYIVGRGSRDNKGPAMVSLYVLRCLRELGIPLSRSLLLYFGCAEERGMADLEWYLARHQAPAFSYTPDAPYSVCYGEKGNFQARLGRELQGSNLLDFRGGEVSNTVPDHACALLANLSPQRALTALQGREGYSIEIAPEGVRLFATGTARHAAFPEGSVNAVQRLAELLSSARLVTGPAEDAMGFLAEALGDYYGQGLGIASADELSGRSTCIGGMAWMEGRRLVLDLNVRYAIRTDASLLRSRLEARCAEHGFALLSCADSPPAYVPKDHPAIAVMDDAVRTQFGDRFHPYVMGGGTYARKLPNAVAFGPSTEDPSPFGGAHQANEGVLLDELERAIGVYVLALTRLDAVL